MKTITCQLCSSSSLLPIIDLGYHPLGDTFLTEADLHKPETRYPLRVLLCTECGFTMLEYLVPAEKRYQDHEYSYTSSNSPIAVKHFDEIAQSVNVMLSLSSNDLVVDIGSNDGTLLSSFSKASGCRIVGIDPSYNISEIARKAGIDTMTGFFDDTTVNTLLSKYGKARVITATNVFNHINDLPAFMVCLEKLLDTNGFFIFEVPYLATLVDQRAFDTIYLEHASYFTVSAFQRFFKKFGMSINHCDETEYMGGSIRVIVSRTDTTDASVETCIAKEQSLKLTDPQTYTSFMSDVIRLKMTLCSELYGLKEDGKHIIGIGAATKGNTLLNYCALDASILDFITDSSPYKIGKFTPGSHIPICNDDAITAAITHAVILPWNIGAFLKEKLKDKKLTFIIPHY